MSDTAPLVNGQLLGSLRGREVRVIGKLSGGTPDGLIRVMAPDGLEISCRLDGQSKPSGTVLTVQVSGMVGPDGVISLRSPILELGGEIDMGVLNEAIGMQFAKPFERIFGIVA